MIYTGNSENHCDGQINVCIEREGREREGERGEERERGERGKERERGERGKERERGWGREGRRGSVTHHTGFVFLLN